MKTPAVGIYYDVPEEEYRAWDAICQSDLKILAGDEPLARFKWETEHHKETSSSMTFGKIAHSAILEPNLPDNNSPLPEGISKRAGKAYEELCANNPNITYLSGAEWKTHEAMKQKAQLVKDSVYSVPEIAEYLSDGSPEVSVVWIEPITKLKCKARIDWMGKGYLIDIKTTQMTTLKGKNRQARKLHYNMQAAFYADAVMNVLKLDLPCPFKFVIVESVEPCLAALFDGRGADLHSDLSHHPSGFYLSGRHKYQDAIKQVKWAMENDDWAGHPAVEHSFSLEQWEENF